MEQDRINHNQISSPWETARRRSLNASKTVRTVMPEEELRLRKHLLSLGQSTESVERIITENQFIRVVCARGETSKREKT